MANRYVTATPRPHVFECRTPDSNREGRPYERQLCTVHDRHGGFGGILTHIAPVKSGGLFF